MSRSRHFVLCIITLLYLVRFCRGLFQNFNFDITWLSSEWIYFPLTIRSTSSLFDFRETSLAVPTSLAIWFPFRMKLMSYTLTSIQIWFYPRWWWWLQFRLSAWSCTINFKLITLWHITSTLFYSTETSKFDLRVRDIY